MFSWLTDGGHDKALQIFAMLKIYFYFGLNANVPQINFI